MQSVKDFINDLRELKDAAASHNLQPDPPHPSNPLPSGTGTSAVAGAPLPPPPPPPRNLPHGWTARYDQREKKYAYSHGVTAQEQWDFPTGARKYTWSSCKLNLTNGIHRRASSAWWKLEHVCRTG